MYFELKILEKKKGDEKKEVKQFRKVWLCVKEKVESSAQV